MIFQNIYLMKYIGMFGNANPHFISDWVKVNTASTTKDKSDLFGSWSSQ